MDRQTPAIAEKRVNWEVAKNCLAALARESPGFLHQAVIIGGAACWFYRHLLAKGSDPDFKAPPFTAEEEAKWLSKDLDFTNVFAEDARQMLADRVTRDSTGRVSIIVMGVPIGFAQVGVTFDPESVWENAWVAAFDAEGMKVECKVIDPVRLYLEKQALSQRRGSGSDGLHLATLTEFLRLETCRQVEALATAATLSERTWSMKFLGEMASKAPEICGDERVRKRVGRVLKGGSDLTPTERQVIERLGG